MNNYDDFDSIPCTGVSTLRVVNMSPHQIIQDGPRPGVILVRSPEEYKARRMFWRPWVLSITGNRRSGGAHSSVISNSYIGGDIMHISNVAGSVVIHGDELLPHSAAQIILPRGMNNISIVSLTY